MGAADVVALLPELLLGLGAVVGLLAGSWLPQGRQGVVRAVVAATALAGIVVTVVDAATARGPVLVASSYVVDTATDVGRVVVLAATVVVLVLAGDRAGPAPGEGDAVTAVGGHPRETEFAVLVALGALGTILLVGCADLLLLAAAALLASVPLYALAGLRRGARDTEAALKFYLTGALLGLSLLLGITLLTGLGAATAYPALARGLAGVPALATGVALVAVLGGLLFEAGGVPAHFWVPDATDGTPPVTGAVLTTLPKVGALLAIWRLVTEAIPTGPSGPAVPWPLLLAVLATASMTLGNLAAFAQTSLRRLLAYSTVSQVGYLLVPVAVAGRTPLALPALLAYLAAYVVTQLAVFAALAARPGALDLAGQRGLARHRPGLAVAITVGLLGLVGTPPTAVFVGKLAGFTAALDGGMGWLAAVAVVNSVASLFYYLRWIAPLFARDLDGPGTDGAGDEHAAPRARVVALVLAVVSVVGVAAAPLVTGPFGTG